MKRLIFLVLLVSLILAGCGSTVSFDEELELFNSGEYTFITNSDLNKYCENLKGTKIYVVTDIDDIKYNAVQSTLDDGYMMSSFDVGTRFKKYKSALKNGEMVAILGTVSGVNSYGFMGKSVQIDDCYVFAVGEAAEAYKKGKSDSSHSGNLTVTEEVANSYSGVSEYEYKSLCNALDYENILRNPDANKGKYCIVSGTVDQIIEGWFDTYTLYVKDANGDKWQCSYTYKDGESHLLEGDAVTVYGKCDGTATPETLQGKQVTLPSVDAEYIN